LLLSAVAVPFSAGDFSGMSGGGGVVEGAAGCATDGVAAAGALLLFGVLGELGTCAAPWVSWAAMPTPAEVSNQHVAASNTPRIVRLPYENWRRPLRDDASS
jgi:hypothetical protein